MWWRYALLSAVFAALTAILAKVGMKGVDSNLVTALRTVVVLPSASVLVFVRLPFLLREWLAWAFGQHKCVWVARH